MKTSANRLVFSRGLRFVVAILAADCAVGGTRAAPELGRPNILFIHADDLGWRDLGCYGARCYSTPTIDALAQGGIRFTRAYAGAPICTPSRACLITGLHCARLRITGQPGYKFEDTNARKFRHPEFQTAFPATTPTVARTLGQAGYRTVLFGKWGFDGSPVEHGFEETIEGNDDSLAEAAAAIFAQRDPRPFFGYLNFSRPHVPLRPDLALAASYAAKPEFQDGTFNPDYAAVIDELDRATGRLLEALDRAGLAESTVVVLGSDNGGFLGSDDERVANNFPLREGKASLYEGGIRVPLIVRWPGVTAPGSTSDVSVHWVDWHATLAEIAGVEAPPGDGRSFAAALRGAGELAPRPLYWHYPHYRRARPGISASPSSAILDGDWKLLHFYEDGHFELYDLRADIRESRDLSPAKPEWAAALGAKLDRWRASIGAQPPVPQPGR